MTDTDVTILLGFAVPPYEMLSETDLPARLAAEPGLLDGIFEQEGQMTITCGAAEAILGDTFLNLVNEMCFRAVVDVSRDGEAVVEMFATDEVVTLRRTEGRITLSGVLHPAVDLPADALLRALHAAGERFLALAETIWPDQGEVLCELRGYAEAVRPFLPAEG